jgi:hypothetical protein
MSSSASPPPAPAAPAQPQKSNVLWWVLGVLFGAVLLFGLGAFLAVFYVSRSISVQEAGNKVEIQTPVGSIRASKDATQSTGLPVYPGAVVTDAGGNVELTGMEEESVSITGAHYRTNDPIEKVDAWYAERLGADFKREGVGVSVKKKDVTGAVLDSNDIAFISEKDELVRVVALKKKFNGVEIVLLRAGKTEPQ